MSKMQEQNACAKCMSKMHEINAVLRTWIRSAQPISGNCSLMGVSRASALGRPASAGAQGNGQSGEGGGA